MDWLLSNWIWIVLIGAMDTDMATSVERALGGRKRPPRETLMQFRCHAH